MKCTLEVLFNEVIEEDRFKTVVLRAGISLLCDFIKNTYLQFLLKGKLDLFIAVELITPFDSPRLPYMNCRMLIYIPFLV